MMMMMIFQKTTSVAVVLKRRYLNQGRLHPNIDVVVVLVIHLPKPM